MAQVVGEVLRGLILYVPRDSVLYRLHPTTKIFIAIAISFSALSTRNYYVASFLLFLTLFLIALARIPVSSLRLFTFVIGWMLTFSAILYVIFYPPSGQILFHFGPLMIGLNSFVAWLLVAIKWLTASYVTALLLVTTKQRDLVVGLHAWKVPYVIVFIAASLFWQLAVVSVDFFTIMEAQMSRGLDYKKGNILTKLSRFVWVGISLLFVSFKRTEEMSNAMASRAFHVTGARTTYSTIPLQVKDYLVTATFAAIAALITANAYLGVPLPFI